MNTLPIACIRPLFTYCGSSPLFALSDLRPPRVSGVSLLFVVADRPHHTATAHQLLDRRDYSIVDLRSMSLVELLDMLLLADV